MNYNDLDTFTKAYIGCALWSTNDNSDDSGGEPFDANYDESDIAPETLTCMAEDCRQFQQDNAHDLSESGLSLERQGRDFWLNRNGHGSGFWDEGQDPLFRRLSAASYVWGTFELYIGDDGLIYGS